MSRFKAHLSQKCHGLRVIPDYIPYIITSIKTDSYTLLGEIEIFKPLISYTHQQLRTQCMPMQRPAFVPVGLRIEKRTQHTVVEMMA